MLFSDANQLHPGGDTEFARAISSNGKVVLGADYHQLPSGGSELTRALESFSDGAAASGMVQVDQEQDFMVRKHLHVPKERDVDLFSSLSWETAKIIGLPLAQDPRQRFVERWLNYYGPPAFLPHYSFAFVLDTTNCPLGTFSNKIVLVGGNVKTKFSGERKDELRTPFTRGNDFVPAVDVQATQLLNLMYGDWLRRPADSIELIVILIAGLASGLGLARLRPMPCLGVAIAAALAASLIAEFLFIQYRLWFPWLIIVAAQIPVALLWSVVFNSVQLYVQNRLYRQSLEMYLPPKLVQKFVNDKDLLKPGARKQELTAFFSDIVSFSTLSEGLDSDELASLMNHYFESAVSLCIHAKDGTVAKYLGDGIFAFWNAPDLQTDHAFRACQAALLFRELPAKEINGKPLKTRIGLHTGIANVGNFGSRLRVDYTAIGDTINLASRLESLNRHLGTEVLISEHTQKGIEGRLLTRFLGNFRVKGFEKSVGVYELVGSLEHAESLRPFHEAFASALKLYRQRDFVWAQAEFRRALELKNNDGPCKFYLKSITELDGLALPTEWAGETTFSEK
jgi:adenylate cyclase